MLSRSHLAPAASPAADAHAADAHGEAATGVLIGHLNLLS
jgi:hypothetical protein